MTNQKGRDDLCKGRHALTKRRKKKGNGNEQKTPGMNQTKSAFALFFTLQSLSNLEWRYIVIWMIREVSVLP